jgi:hypothetical protein
MALNITAVSKRGGWQAGQSGNPKGAPKRSNGRTLQELAREHTEEALKTLVVAMRFKGPQQVPAAIAVLDRGWGRPAQRIETQSDHLHLHLLAAQLVEAFDAPQPQQEQQQPLIIDGSVPTE